MKYSGRAVSACLPCLLVAFVAFLPNQRASAQTLRGAHPYLMYTDADIAKFRARLSASPNDKAAFETLVQDVEKAQQPQSSQAMEAACLAFRMTKRPEFVSSIKAGLERLEKRLDAGDASLLRRDPPWHSGLGAGNNVLAYGIGFDCIHEQLSPTERKHYADTLAAKGLRPILDDWLLAPTRIHALDTMGHNWWSAIVFNAGIGAMAILQERPDMLPVLQKIAQASKEWYSYAGSELETKSASFDRAGGFYESVNYASFALSEYLRFVFAWQNAFRSPELPKPPFMSGIGKFFLNASYPATDRTMQAFFGDGNARSNGYAPVLTLWALGEHSDANLWYLHRFDGDGLRREHTNPFALVYGPDANQRAHAPATPGLQPSMLYSDMGWGMLRSSWAENGTLLAIKSGFTWNHAHADAGSFMLFHRGDALLVDSGGTTSYAAPEYDAYYRQSRAHNVVLFDGEAEFHDDTYYGSQFPGTLSHLIDSGNVKYVLANATGPTVWKFRRNFRHVLWIGGVILIIDDVKAYQPGQFQWLLHVGEKATLKDSDLQVAGAHGEVLVHPLFPQELPPGLPADFPEGMRLVEKTGLKDHDITHTDTYFSFEPSIKTDQTTFVTALVLKDPAKPLPKLERFGGKYINGIRITQNGTVTEVYVNTLAEGRIRHRNAIVNANGWATDAYLMALSFSENTDRANPENLTNLFVADGSYLRRGDKAVGESLSKVFMNAAYSEGKVDITLQGQPDIRLSLMARPGERAVLLNGKQAAAQSLREGLLQVSLERQ